MFDNVINYKKQGDIGMSYAIAYYSKLGWTVSIPITDSQDYDIVVDDGVNIFKVQVKTTTQRAKNGIFRVSLRTNGGNKSRLCNKLFDSNKCDLLFIMTNCGDLFSIPRNEIYSTTQINLTDKYLSYKVSLF